MGSCVSFCFGESLKQFLLLLVFVSGAKCKCSGNGHFTLVQCTHALLQPRNGWAKGWLTWGGAGTQPLHKLGVVYNLFCYKCLVAVRELHSIRLSTYLSTQREEFFRRREIAASHFICEKPTHFVLKKNGQDSADLKARTDPQLKFPDTYFFWCL